MQLFSAAWRPVTILLFVTALVIVVKYPLDAFSSGYDPYYHVAHSIAQLHGETFSYPQLTRFADTPGDPWFVYHTLIGYAVIGLGEFGLTPISASILLHALFSGALFAIFYLFLVTLYRRLIPHYRTELETRDAARFMPRMSAESLALATIGLTLLLGNNFVFRTIILERPHLLMISLTMLLTIGLLTRRHWLVFLSATLAPLVYSLPVFLFLPFVGFALGWVSVSRRFADIAVVRLPFFLTVAGLGFGILLHPHTSGYLINGIAFHAFAILQSLFGWLPFLDMRLVVPAEMASADTIPGAFFFFLLMILLAQCYNRSLQYQNGAAVTEPERSSEHVYEVGFGRLAAFLLAGSLLINRLTEYAIPFAMMVAVSYGVFVLTPLARYHFANALSQPNNPTMKVINETLQKARTLLRHAGSKALIGIFAVYVVLALLLVFRESAFQHRLEPDRFAGAAEFLAERQQSDETVLLAQFSYYPQLVYHEPSVRASIGMDDRMVYFFEPQLAHDINRFVGAIEACQADCPPAEPELIPDFMAEHGITHVLIDAEALSEERVARIEGYSFLRMVYTDERYPTVRVYALTTPE